MTNFERAFKLVAGPRVEAGFSMDPEDPGNWTGGKKGLGVLKGTNYGISAKAYPNEDIQNLTLERVQVLYQRDYWDAHKCNGMPWGKALVVFDTAVNGGLVATWWAKFGALPLEEFLNRWTAARIYYWSTLPIWARECGGWVARALLIYTEAQRSE